MNYSKYEYSEPFRKVIDQIQRKDYDLDNIMYIRMKKYIINYCKNNFNTYKILNTTTKQSIFIHYFNLNDLNDVKYRDSLLNCYKDSFLLKHNKLNNICGLEPYNYFQVGKLLNDLKYSDESVKKEIPKKYTHKNLYKLWVKL